MDKDGTDISKILDYKFLLSEILKRIKHQMEETSENVETAILRIESLEENVELIQHKLNSHLKDCERDNKKNNINIHSLISKLIRNIEDKVTILEDSLKSTCSRVSNMEEKKTTANEKIKLLQDEMQLLKKMYVKYIPTNALKNKREKVMVNNSSLDRYFSKLKVLNYES